MGMYTQVRGWININSINPDNKVFEAIETLKRAKQDFEEAGTCHRAQWVCKDTHVMAGGNGTIFIFIGTELKNYDDDAEKWIEHLVTYFPTAEGRIDFQYELVAIGDQTPYWLIHNGVITKDQGKAWTTGYGNGC